MYNDMHGYFLTPTEGQKGEGFI